MRLPSGDQAGSASSVRLSVTGFSPLPPGLMV